MPRQHWRDNPSGRISREALFRRETGLSAPFVADDYYGEVAATGGANFAGTATITFSQSASLFAPSSLSGTATATFGQSGAFSAPTSLGGTATVVFSQSGDLDAPGAFSGTGTIIFGQQGDFSAAQAGANLSGTATIVFDGQGTLSAPVAMSGTATATFGQSATLQAGSALVGTATITTGQSGSMFGPALFSGAASILFGASGDFAAGQPVDEPSPVLGVGAYSSRIIQKLVFKWRPAKLKARATFGIQKLPLQLPLPGIVAPSRTSMSFVWSGAKLSPSLGFALVRDRDSAIAYQRTVAERLLAEADRIQRDAARQALQQRLSQTQSLLELLELA